MRTENLRGLVQEWIVSGRDFQALGAAVLKFWTAVVVTIRSLILTFHYAVLAALYEVVGGLLS